jgi:hypothetical protein
MPFEIRDIEYKHFNERDVETPALLSALADDLPNVKSFLDVGAHYSWYSYAPLVRQMLDVHPEPKPHYMACDVLDCPQTKAIVDEYLISDVKLLDVEADFVACVSAIEHSGISTYKEKDYRKERWLVFEALAGSARKHLFVTFPFGREGVYEGQYANITADDLAQFRYTAGAYGLPHVSARFFYTEFAQGQKPWEEIAYESAKDIPMDKVLGTQCVCIFHASKG